MKIQKISGFLCFGFLSISLVMPVTGSAAVDNKNYATCSRTLLKEKLKLNELLNQKILIPNVSCKFKKYFIQTANQDFPARLKSNIVIDNINLNSTLIDAMIGINLDDLQINADIDTHINLNIFDTQVITNNQTEASVSNDDISLDSGTEIEVDNNNLNTVIDNSTGIEIDNENDQTTADNQTEIIVDTPITDPTVINNIIQVNEENSQPIVNNETEINNSKIGDTNINIEANTKEKEINIKTKLKHEKNHHKKFILNAEIKNNKKEKKIKVDASAEKKIHSPGKKVEIDAKTAAHINAKTENNRLLVNPAPDGGVEVHSIDAKGKINDKEVQTNAQGNINAHNATPGVPSVNAAAGASTSAASATTPVAGPGASAAAAAAANANPHAGINGNANVKVTTPATGNVGAGIKIKVP